MESKTILLVEDNPDDVALTLRALKKNDIASNVVVARDGLEALDLLFGPEGKPTQLGDIPPVLVLLDLKLPRISGIEVLQRLRSEDRTKHVPVVILTTSREEQDIIDGYRFGANSYIRKPVDFEKFVEAVRQLGLYWLVLNEVPPSSAGR
jgi:two-component system, response regulator